MYVIDFHSHILPGVDDGSTNLEMSDAMLDEAYLQNVDVQVLTPHFYADHTNPERFFEKRNEAYEKLVPIANKNKIRLRLGAEVAYFRNMHETDILGKLTVNGSRVILIEMPFDQWTGKEVDTIDGILRRGLIPVLAHVDRYISLQRDEEVMEEIFDKQLICQINCEALDSFFERRKVLKTIGTRAFVLGSDAHNLKNRAPNLKIGRDVIKEKMGEEVLMNVDILGNAILGYKTILK